METNQVIENEAPQAVAEVLVLGTKAVSDKYTFKKDKTTGVKRPHFMVSIPVPTLESLFAGADIAKDAEGNYIHPEHKEIFSLLQDAVKKAGKEIVDASTDNESVVFPDGIWDFGKLARQPKYARAGSGVEKEDLEALCQSYKDIMLPILGEAKARGIKIACQYFMRRCSGIDAVEKSVIAKIRENLGTWFVSIDADKQETFATVYEYLDGKLGEVLNLNTAEVF